MESTLRQIFRWSKGELAAWIGVVGSVGSLISTVVWVWTQLPRQWAGFLILICFTVSLLTVVLVVSASSIRIRQENRIFRESQAVFHGINHTYRDTLSTTFGHGTIVDPAERAVREKETLRYVCDALSRLFYGFTHVPCVVTVKIIMNGRDGAIYARTFTRSESHCPRDVVEPFDFQLRTGRNTGLDAAMKMVQGQVSHFFEPDLHAAAERGAYQNERPNWRACYRTAIVVPIRHVTGEKDRNGWVSDNVGFLAVDTNEANMLNGDFHVQLLAGCADQMYNFMSLMRGKFAVPSQPHESENV